MYLLMCIVGLTVFGVQGKKQELIHEVFDVKPGGTEHEFQYKAFGVTCKFTYVCQGGTNEQWVLEMEKLGKHVLCNILRPSGSSYLFFQQFKAEIIGGKLIEGIAKTSGRKLDPDEYVTDHNSIHHVEGKFKSQLSEIRVRAEKQRTEEEL